MLASSLWWDCAISFAYAYAIGLISYDLFSLVRLGSVQEKRRRVDFSFLYSLILNPLQDWNWIKLWIMSRAPDL
jgi:hypothetical protein